MAASITWISKNTSTTSGTTFTWVGQDLGAAASDRLVVVGALGGNGGGTGTISACSVQSITGTVDAETTEASSSTQAGMFHASVPTGTTGDVSVTFSTTRGRAGIEVSAITGASSTPSDTDAQQGDPGSLSLTVGAGGVFAGFVGTPNQGNGGVTWTNATEDDDTIVQASARMSAAHGSASATVGFESTAAGSGFILLAVAAVFDAAPVTEQPTWKRWGGVPGMGGPRAPQGGQVWGPEMREAA
jgi:hypothetical protein